MRRILGINDPRALTCAKIQSNRVKVASIPRIIKFEIREVYRRLRFPVYGIYLLGEKFFEVFAAG